MIVNAEVEGQPRPAKQESVRGDVDQSSPSTSTLADEREATPRTMGRED